MPVTPTYRTEDRALSRPKVDFAGSERARRFLALFYLVESELDPVYKQAKDLTTAGRLGLGQVFAQTHIDYFRRG